MTHFVKRASWIGLFLLASAQWGAAGDWPMWRYDGARGGATPDALPEQLHLQWVRQLPDSRPAWPPDQTRLQFDLQAQPVAMGRRLFVPSSRNDSVTAYDTRSGEELWRFYADGPVRFAPVAHGGDVCFTSDDGYLYCIGAENGKLLRKFNGAPAERLAIGNHRLVSSWPARGGPVLHDGKLFFGASIWSFMGIFIHALDPNTFDVHWTNSGDGTNYTVQPHNAPAFAAVAPQGHLAAHENNLVIPGGRGTPGIYDARTGKMKFFIYDKKLGTHEVIAGEKLYFSGGHAHTMADGQPIGGGTPAIIDGTTMIATDPNAILARDLDPEFERIETVDKKGKKTISYKTRYEEVFRHELKDPISGKWFIKAGPRLYAGGPGKVAAYSLKGAKDGKVEPAWEAEIEGDVWTMLAADDRLFVVTEAGQLYCFGAEIPSKVTRHEEAIREAPGYSREWGKRADAILAREGAREGYALALGIGSGELINALLAKSDLHIIAVDRDAAKVEELRRAMQAAGLYGDRIAARVGDPSNLAAFPSYFANLLISEDAGVLETMDTWKAIYHTLRPYGGVAAMEFAFEQHEWLKVIVDSYSDEFAGAALERKGSYSFFSRNGALPGSGDWTHQYGDASQSLMSADDLVKAPFGVLWFGGPPNDGILPRHGHGPSPQVAGGRLFIEGSDKLRAVDVYTGRLLWEKPLPGFGEYYNVTAHFAGAGEVGSNYVSLPDRVYAVYGSAILEINSRDGETVREFKLPPEEGQEPPLFGFVSVSGDYLVATASPLGVALPKPAPGKSIAEAVKAEPAEKLGRAPAARQGSGSKTLLVFERKSGELLWSREAETNFRHNNIAIGADRIFCIDSVTEARKLALARRGITLEGTPTLHALEMETGRELWSVRAPVFGTFLNYSPEHDILVQAGSASRDRALDEVANGIAAFRGSDGAVLWHEKELDYGGPCILWGDRILTNGAGGFAIEMKTGKKTGWTYNRTYGCNTALGGKHLLTFRSGAAGFCDLGNDSGTGNLGGFRSSCTNNLIPANGVLNAPDYTRTCTCSYQNQASLALIHMPEAEFWTFGAKHRPGRIGINFGAPGDRRSAEGTLFVDYPSVGGVSDEVPVKVEGSKVRYFRNHSAGIQGALLPWVAASGVEGAERIEITAFEKEETLKACTVRLFFPAQPETGSGERLFDVNIQDNPVIRSLDIAALAGVEETLFREFKGVEVRDKLRLTFSGAPSLISGVEIVRED